MATSKKPTKKPAKKVIDVKSPGESEASATSRPIINTNHQLAQDPMVTAGASEASDEASGPPALSSHGRTIVPLSSADKTKPPEAETADTKPAPTASELVSKLEAKHASEAQSSPPLDADVVENANQPSETAAKDASNEEPSPASPAEPTPETSGPASAETGSASDSVTEPSADPSPASKAKAEAEAAEQAEAEQKRQAELDGLVESGEYFVPINQVRKRHDRYWLALVVTILVAIVVLDLLFDAGILKIAGFNFYTNFLNG